VTERADVVVIGAGADGLVAASLLARAGLDVRVLEQSDAVGGLGRAIEFAPGFRAAPLGPDPGWLPPSIARDLGLGPLETVASDSALSVAAEPGQFLTLSRDPGKAAAAIRDLSPADAAKWPAFTSRLHRLADFLAALYLLPAPDVDTREAGELLALARLGLKFRSLGREDMTELLRTLPMSVWDLLEDTFECSPLKAAVAAGGIQDIQQGPRSGGTGFVLLHHLVGAPMGSVRGRVPWRGGPSAFTDAAEAVARRSGAKLRTGARVERILISNDAVTGVALEGGEEVAAKAVLSTANPARTLLEWVDPVWLDPELLHAAGNIRHRGCTSVVLYALESLPEIRGLTTPEALGGVVSLTSSLAALERAADAAKYGTVPEQPHIELTAPTLHWPALAPEGRHVLAARVHYAPYRLRDDGAWDDARRDALADRVDAAIERVAPGFGARIRQRVAWSPRDLEVRYGLREGAASHGELGLDQILFMRPIAGWGRYATPVAGLYLGGAGTHPGPGILGGSGSLAAKRMIHDRRGR
jgi:phytoene dehydrogenase-like protein